MPEKAYNWSSNYSKIGVFFAFFTICLGYAIFWGLMESIEWSVKQFAVIVFFFMALSLLHNRYDAYSNPPITLRLFFMSLLVKATFCTYILLVFDFPNVSPVQVWFSELLCYPDAHLYHNIAVSFAKNISNGVLSLPAYYAKTHGASDYGYPLFLGLVYYLFSPQPICALISNVILSSISVVLTYKISFMVFECRKTSYLAAVISMLFPYLNYYTAFPLKETLVICLILAYFYFLISLIKLRGNELVNFIGTVILMYLMLYFRIVLYFLVSICFVAAIYFRYSKQHNIAVNLSMMISIAIALLIVFSLTFKESKHEVLSTIEQRYTQIEGQIRDVNIQREIKKKTTKGEFLVLTAMAGLIAPFPSFVSVGTRQLTNIQFGNVIIKNIMIFFSFIGAIVAIRSGKKIAQLLLLFYIGYVFSLSISGNILQHRFQLIGLPFLIIFISYGIINSSIRHVKLWIIYLHCLLLIILAWNYYKLYIRAML